MEIAEHHFRAMGSDAHLVVVGGPEHRSGPSRLADAAMRRIDRLERLWSRFLPDSEISRLNQRAGTPLRVSAETAELLIDPQTGLPSDTDVNFSTVIAPDASVAEVLAKAVLLRGSTHPFDVLGGTGAEALVVDRGGNVQCTDGFRAYVAGQAIPDSLLAAAR